MKKLERRKNNNKGFSLVELIVVVLIIAIVAVALAPNVMKWVGKSKDSVDKNNAASIEAAVNVAVADFMDEGGTLKDVSYTIHNGGLTITNGVEPTGTNNLSAYILEVMNGDYPEVTKESGKVFEVTITESGAVSVAEEDGTFNATPSITPAP